MVPPSSEDAAGEHQPLLSNVETWTPSSGTADARQSVRADEDTDQTEFAGDNEHLLFEALYPRDVFDNKVYWADLAGEERLTWIKETAKSECKHEVERIQQLAKIGWIEPIKAYLRKYARSGTGFFIEGYVLFSVGNVMPLFKSIWPQCWNDNQVCDAQTIKAIKYMEIVGIICGQVVVGYLGDAIGRRWGLVQDAGIMLIGTILLTAMTGNTLEGWTIMYVVAIFVFGLGVGGEYPMTSTTSIEGMKGSQDRSHRGRSACLAFLMQGWGQLANQLVLMLLTVITSSTKSLGPPYTKFQVQVTFRTTFAVSGVCLVYFLYLRIRKFKDADDTIQEDRKEQNRSSGYDWASFKFVLSRFWARLLATSVCWFCSDFAFYGIQIFRNDLIELVTGASFEEVHIIWLYNLINIACQLVGYYMAALLVDHKRYGRRRMQIVGFLAQFIIYTAISCLFPMLSQPGVGAKVFQALYFIAGFWVQFGPNSTTFLIAAEVYPVSVRSTAHGFSAAVGKLGALAASVSFNYIEDRTKFILVAISTLIGCILTSLFVPDTTGLCLAETQRAWRFVTSGRHTEYHGVAIHPQHLSWYERHARNRHELYDLDHDRNQRVNELRKLFQRSKTDMEQANNETEQINQNLIKYFELEQSQRH